MPKTYLAQYLRYFYANLKKKDGSFYSPATLLCIRSSINRYLTSSEVGQKLNICSDPDFKSSNTMLKVMVSKFLNDGGRIKNYPPIEEEDLPVSYTHLTLPTILLV